MGGVANVDRIEKLGKIPAISGNLFNCYSKNDKVLKYIFRIAKFGTKAVGLNPI